MTAIYLPLTRVVLVQDSRAGSRKSFSFVSSLIRIMSQARYNPFGLRATSRSMVRCSQNVCSGVVSEL